MKFALSLILVSLAAFVRSGVITPPNCASGGGTAFDAVVTVTGLSGNQPYTLTALNIYNVTYTFYPISSATVANFTVTADLSVDGVELEVAVASAPVGPLIPVSYLGLGGIIGLQCVDLFLIHLYESLGAITPSVATVFVTVPNLQNATAIFRGSVTSFDGSTVFVCKEGLVNIV